MVSELMVNTIYIEVAYALPNKQVIIGLDVAEGICMLEAARRSGISHQFPELDIENSEMGIFGKVEKAPATCKLRAGDRVEIYRPLVIDPKEVRKQRAAKAKAKKNLELES